MPHKNNSFFTDTSAIFNILSNISDGFAFIDNNWQVVFWNKSAERITAVSKDEVVGFNLWEKFNITPESLFYKEYYKAKRDNVTVEFETYYEPIQGWIEVKAYPAKQGLAVYFKDVTERKKLSLQIEHQKKQTEALIDASHDVIYSVDRNYRLLVANIAFLRNTYLYSGKEIKPGDCVIEIMSKEEGDRWKPFYDEALKGNIVSHDRLIMYQINGEAVYTEIHFNPIKDQETKEVTGVACYARDVTASKRYIALIENKNARLQESDAKLQKAVESLTRQNEILREIAFIQSHEVRRPLANILGLIEAIVEQKELASPYVEHLKKSSEELDSMIRKIVAKTNEISQNADHQS